MYGHWRIPFKFNPDLYAGFVYVVTNNVTNKRYIGKKNFRYRSKESNWKRYIGSSSLLKSDINQYGKESFSFSIVMLIADTSELIKAESKLQTLYNVPENDQFYNRSIACRALDATGACRDDKFKRAISAAHKGRVAPNKGVPCSTEAKEKISKANKGKKRSPEISAKLSKLRKGKPQSEARIQNNINQQDKTVYTWVHPDHGTISCTCRELSSSYDLRNDMLRRVITGYYKSYKKWSLIVLSVE